MSTKLNLVERLLARGRHLQESGRQEESLRILGRLATFKELPAAVVEETQARLAEIQLGRRQYRRARRHLAIALIYQPNSPRYHYMMGSALNADEEADVRRAAKHYRKSLRQDPKQPRCRAELGLLKVELGLVDAGLRDLRLAVDMAEDDLEILDRLVEGLRLAERPAEIRRVLQAARFRRPRDTWLQKMWNDFQFDQIHRRQQDDTRRELPLPADVGPVILPFLRPAKRPNAGGKVRRDPPAALPGPHHTRRVEAEETTPCQSDSQVSTPSKMPRPKLSL